MSTTNNGFISLQESASGRVSVMLQKNSLNGNGTYVGRVARYTCSQQNVLDVMAESLPNIDVGEMASVLNAYVNAVLKALSTGNAVKFGELGTFYIAGKGAVDSESGKPELTVRFTAASALKEAVKDVEIVTSEYTAPSGIITSVTDVSSGMTDGTLTQTGSVLLEGSNLKVGGDDSGIWFAPVTEYDTHSSDESCWIKTDTTLVYNLPRKLLFALPASIGAGQYKIVVRTRYAGAKNYERKYLVEAVSDTVTVA